MPQAGAGHVFARSRTLMTGAGVFMHFVGFIFEQSPQAIVTGPEVTMEVTMEVKRLQKGHPYNSIR